MWRIASISLLAAVMSALCDRSVSAGDCIYEHCVNTRPPGFIVQVGDLFCCDLDKQVSYNPPCSFWPERIPSDDPECVDGYYLVYQGASSGSGSGSGDAWSINDVVIRISRYDSTGCDFENFACGYEENPMSPYSGSVTRCFQCE